LVESTNEAEVWAEYRRHQDAATAAYTRSQRERRIAIGHEKMAEGMRLIHPYLEKNSQPRPSEPPEGRDPRGWAAVEQALSNRPGRFYSLNFIHRRLVGLGWEEDSVEGAARVRAAVGRGFRLGLLERNRTNGVVKYALKTSDESTTSRDPDEAGPLL
jgi:hypothetical protein